MVMMHELAHCVQMNHSGAFWKLRNLYAGELRLLWGRGYTGDGFWGRGKTVLSEEYEGEGNVEGEVVVERVCGGTFRSGRGRKRKRKGGVVTTGESLTYAERQQRKIVKKFGVNGVALGDDTETRVKLENGKKPKGKPRVAGSARGRELRAAAALARFTDQKEDDDVKKEEQADSGSSQTESDDDQDAPPSNQEAARDLDGSRLLDAKGNNMVKVCETEDQDDIHVKEEMRELQTLDYVAFHSPGEPSTPAQEPDCISSPRIKTEEPSTAHDTESPPSLQKPQSPPPRVKTEDEVPTAHGTAPPPPPQKPQAPPSHPSNQTSTPNPTCPICTTLNAPTSLLCAICAHVLDTSKVPGWRCGNAACEGSAYLNARDCGVCGVCGGRKGGAGGVRAEA